ncbi:DUF2057 domain-containing protein [Photobacterium sp. NCIMB 13483]|uniref:Uncharacterized protein n=1 Tax=Photobacterium piscicola TaxID=1378299 RepID=A0A1T5I220_9GAMM|nr:MULTISPECIES: DUF2057 family protein [Photobacterium]PST86231.1 DUF2057 domain-containing protein [Photobacterium sp. NCIMB 13483]SKC33103.1 hypothetical protein CZ809_02638 [Photobacterium piscicola]
MNIKTSAIIAGVIFTSMSAPSWAETNLQTPSNVEILATKAVYLKNTQHQVTLPAGQQQLLVRFDSPENPHSTGQTMGYVNSSPVLLRFKLDDQATVTVKIPRLDTPQEINRFAKQPYFKLYNDDGSQLALEQKVIPMTGSPLFTDYNKLLNESVGEAVVPVAMVTNKQMSHSKSTAVTSIDTTHLTAQQTDQLLQQLYQQANKEQRKKFIRWALEL